MFITFEGSEGCGKSTQVASLADFLRRQGLDVLTTREPGGTPIGDQIRQVLFGPNSAGMHPRAEILLLQAARAQHVEQVIRPQVASGGVVLCDRYADSTLAYQGYGYRLDLAQLRQLVHFATGGMQPDLTLLLEVDVEEGLRRRRKEGGLNRLDGLDIDFYQRVRQGYLEMAQAEPHRWVVVDANLPASQVQEQIRQVVLERLKAKTG